MIQVVNISKLRDYLGDETTVILTGSSDLPDNEKVEIDRQLGPDLRASYERWIDNKGRHNFKFVPEQNKVFINPLNDLGFYNGDILSDCFYNICSRKGEGRFVKKLVMIGLPGKQKSERERARQDLLRWFNATGTELIVVLCDEAQ